MKTPFLSLIAPSALLSIALAGCTGTETAPPAPTVTLQDTFDSDPFGPNEGALHSPYVPGASFQISLVTSDSAAGWTATSSDSSVLLLTPTSDGAFSAQARAAGHATLTVQDPSGLEITSRGVDVVVPTTARLYAPGRLLAGQSDALAQEPQLDVLTGQAAMLLVRYFAGETEVRGQASPGLIVGGGLQAEVLSTGVAYDRDWLRVTPVGSTGVETNLGPTSVQLVLADAPLATIAVNGVAPADVAALALDAQPEANAQSGQGLFVVARGVDASGDDVFGVSLTWSLDGQTLSLDGNAPAGPDDVVAYTYDATSSDTLSGNFEAQVASVRVHASHAPSKTALVETTLEAPSACSVAAVGARSHGALGAWGALGIGLMAARRRRRAA